MKHIAMMLVLAFAGCETTDELQPDVGSTSDAAEQPFDAQTTDTAAPDATLSDGHGGDHAATDASMDASPPVDVQPVDVGPELRARFVAQGHMGRTAVSCDDGRTWAADTSLDDGVRCFIDGFDCDHHPGAGRGVEFGDGVFLITFGWGPPGGVDRSSDGINWTRVLSDTTFGGIVFGNSIWLAAARRAQRSTDGGLSWVEVNDTAMTGWNVRRAAFVNADGGRFIMVADDELVVSADAESWTVPSVLPDTCGDGIQTRGGIGYGNDAILIVGSAGNGCLSNDAGDTWRASDLGGEVSSHLLFDGEQFVAWGRGMMYSSPDGDSWTATPTQPADLDLGPTSYNPDTGTYVGVRGGWQTWYDEQRFYRSSDGMTWETLPNEAFQGGHPIRDISIGWVADDIGCP